jgi:TP901 family phage tail tape measure protein
MAAPIALASRQFALFDDAIRLTGAVSGAAGADLQKLNDTARQLGATTSFTAVQVASLMGELGRAGFKPDQINAMTGAVLDLARATGTDATLSAGIMAATLRQFSLGATEATRAADVLTKAANATFNTVEGLGESLKYAGPVAKSLGISLEDTVAVLGVLGNVGIQGSEAGTALRRLSVIAAGSGDELQKIFGITNTDAAGNLKPLVDVLDEINTVTAGMPVAERTAKMAQAFGLLGITSANVLSASADGVRGLANDLRNAGGTAAKTAKEMDAGLGGSIRILLSAIEGTALAIGDAMAPSLQRLGQIAIDVSGGLTKFIKENQELVVSFAKGIAIFIGAGAAILGIGIALKIVAAGMALVLSPLGLILAAVAGLSAAVLSSGSTLSDLAATAQTTFSGVYEAIAGGDLAGAMDILWAGLHAGWLRGVEVVMGYVDSWVALFQNTFTYAGAGIAATWESMWSGLVQGANTIGAVVMGVVDNLVNGVMAAFDAMVAAVRKSWNWVQSFIVKGYDLARENSKVDSEMTARAAQRQASRPGVGGRMAQAARQNAETARDTQGRIDAMTRGADEIAQGRLNENDRRASDRRDATLAAEGRVADLSRNARDNRAFRGQADSVIGQLGTASSMDQIRELNDEFAALAETGRLTETQLQAFADASESAEKRLDESGAVVASTAGVDSAAVAEAAAGATNSQAEVAGTFSASAVGGMGFGQSLSQKQVDLLGKIEANTRDIEGGSVKD